MVIGKGHRRKSDAKKAAKRYADRCGIEIVKEEEC